MDMDRGPKYLPVTSDLPLQKACGEGRLLEVEEFLKVNPDLVNNPDNAGVLPIHTAVLNYESMGKNRRIYYLLDKAGCYLNAVTMDSNGWTALHLAVSENRAYMVDLLLSLGVNINAQDCRGDTPLHISCRPIIGKDVHYKNIDFEIIQQLLKAKADPNIQNKCGGTALFAAAIHSSEQVRCLLDNRADPTITNNFGQTALFRGHVDYDPGIGYWDTVVIEILAEVCPVDIEDINGETALIAAIRHRCPGDVKMLLDKGADVNHRDRFGATPLHISIESQYSDEITRLLMDRGADCTITDNYGADALHWASWYSHNRIVKALRDSKRFSENAVDDHDNDYQTLAQWRLNDGFLKLYQQRSPPDSGHIDSTSTGLTLWVDRRPYVTLYPNGEVDVSKVKYLPLPPLISLLDRPGVGRLTSHPDVNDVHTSVRKLMDLISVKIGELCPQFTCSITASGSSNEGTKCGLPDEFDFLFCLEHFAEDCEPEESNEPGYAKLNLKKGLSNEKMDFYRQFIISGENTTLPRKIISYFARLLKIALNTSTLWQDHDLPFVLKSYTPRGPNLVISLLYRGKIFKHMQLSIDMVPAVYMKGFLSDKLKGLPNLVPEDVSNRGCNLVLRGCNQPEALDVRFYQISFVETEVYILKNVPVWMRNAYILMKSMKNTRVWPPVHDGRMPEPVDEDPPGKFNTSTSTTQIYNSISTYMIKTVFFSQAVAACLQQNEYSGLTDEVKIRKMVAKMLDSLLDSCTKSSLPSFFLSDVDLLSSSWKTDKRLSIQIVTDKQYLKYYSDKQHQVEGDLNHLMHGIYPIFHRLYLIQILKYLYLRY